MKIQISILIDDDVYLNENIIQMRRTKKLSNYINNLLRTSMNITKDIIPEEQEKLENLLTELNVKKEALMNSLDKLKEDKEKEESRWKQIY